ncbi:zinc ribbon domain-containing protein [Schleiferilactobacillus harbinensis]|uniref:zinc ribbon domain-containing protein n=1 Tax=Schleiferilactobacillus harbinensis TaxID=304207 RepID=UPI0039ECDD00
MDKQQYVCPKCVNETYEADQFQATGGNFAKIFDVQNKKFVTISCTRCGYTELYRATSSEGWNVLDFLLGGG